MREPCRCIDCQAYYRLMLKPRYDSPPREMVLDDICPRVIDLGNGDTFVRRMPDADYDRAFK